jgi:hypothetical protein
MRAYTIKSEGGSEFSAFSSVGKIFITIKASNTELRTLTFRPEEFEALARLVLADAKGKV